MSYKMDNGESLYEIQRRNIQAFNQILVEKNGSTIIIGTHGTALATILNYYDSTFQYKDFMKFINTMPYIVKIEFERIDYVRRIDNIIENQESCKNAKTSI